VHINRFDHPEGGRALAAELAAAGAAAEAAGVNRLSVMDHYFQMEFNSGAEAPMLEAYTALAYLAAHTSTVRLGALVMGVTYTATQGCSPRSPPRSTSSPAAGQPWASERPGTTASTTAWTCPTRRSPSGSNGWRRP
jgi:hypothetical protein